MVMMLVAQKVGPAYKYRRRPPGGDQRDVGGAYCAAAPDPCKPDYVDLADVLDL